MTNVKTPFCFETQGPCGSVRTCIVDTVTDDTIAQVKDVTPVTLSQEKNVSRSEGLRTCGGREHPKHQSADFTFQVLGSFTRTKSDAPNIASMSSSSIGILRPFLLFLRRSPLSVFGFDGETLLSKSHVKDTRTQRFIQSARSHGLRQVNLPASRTDRSGEDNRPFIQRLPRHSRHGYPR